MAEDWFADVQKYAPHADPDDVAGIVRYCGIALRKRDSALVSFSSATETARVRDNFLKKKLALTQPNSELDAAIAAVGEQMKGDRTRNRVTVYYLLAERFDKLALFRKAGGSRAASKPAPVSPPSAAPADAQAAPPAAANEGSPALFTGGGAATPARSFGTAAPAFARTESPEGAADRADRFVADTPETVEPAGFNWWPWLLLIVLVIVVILIVAWRT